MPLKELLSLKPARSFMCGTFWQVELTRCVLPEENGALASSMC